MNTSHLWEGRLPDSLVESGQFRSIPIVEIPPTVAERVRPLTMDILVRTTDIGSTFVLPGIVTADPASDNPGKKLLYTEIFDFNAAGKWTGKGGVEVKLTRGKTDLQVGSEPYPGWTMTNPGFRRNGRGISRLRIMNVLAEHMYGRPLHSSTEIKPEAEAIWRKLVGLGEAEHTEPSVAHEFRFKRGITLKD